MSISQKLENVLFLDRHAPFGGLRKRRWETPHGRLCEELCSEAIQFSILPPNSLLIEYTPKFLLKHLGKKEKFIEKFIPLATLTELTRTWLPYYWEGPPYL